MVWDCSFTSFIEPLLLHSLPQQFEESLILQKVLTEGPSSFFRAAERGCVSTHHKPPIMSGAGAAIAQPIFQASSERNVSPKHSRGDSPLIHCRGSVKQWRCDHFKSELVINFTRENQYVVLDDRQLDAFDKFLPG
ncbi:hypothetical protein Salat_1267400 [Sesamum alatum]|uniref:Uncharacterized protein n=1 Tax=Sesamum alatum TaxID=300844 RepID=A0AAE1YGK7_9LAMI|nr:hypothetical protein Salat_1267400 [Sesamum alatum]